jgi:hypothetical protein
MLGNARGNSLAFTGSMLDGVFLNSNKIVQNMFLPLRGGQKGYVTFLRK